MAQIHLVIGPLLSSLTMSAASSKSATDNVLVHTALKSTQAVSILAPPIFVGYHLLRRQPFSIKSFFRKVNLVAVAGAAVAVPVAAYVLKDEAEVEMSERQGKLVSRITLSWALGSCACYAHWAGVFLSRL